MTRNAQLFEFNSRVSPVCTVQRWESGTAWQTKPGSIKPVNLSSPSRCIVGLYVKPTWRPPALERFVRSVGVFWSQRPPGDPLPSHIRRVMWSPSGPGGRTVRAGPRSVPKCSPPCGEAGAGCSAVPSCSVEVWVCIRPWSSGSSSTWPRRRARWVSAQWCLWNGLTVRQETVNDLCCCLLHWLQLPHVCRQGHLHSVTNVNN